MDDLISRQAAISAICNDCGKIDCDKMDKCEKLQLPPANCSEFPNNSDTISRQAAIGIVEFECGEWRGLAKTIAEEIKQLPSAQPEITRRIVGKSKGGMTLWYECERCGEPVDEGDKFCRGCGAKMEVTT